MGFAGCGPSADTRHGSVPIVVDGTAYYVLLSDLTRDDFTVLRAANPDGKKRPFVLVSHTPPVSNVGSDAWSAYVNHFQQRLEGLARQSSLVNLDRFQDRLPIRAKAVVRGGSVPQTYGKSTASLSDDDGKHAAKDPQYGRAYASIYGVDVGQIQSPEGDYELRSGTLCADHKTWDRRVIYLNGEELRSIVGYCDVEEFVPKEIGAVAIAFLQKYKPQIDAATAILASRHPSLRLENLRSEFVGLVVTEFELFDSIDVAQDIAASEYAGVPKKVQERMHRDFPLTAWTQVMKWGWGPASYLVDVSTQAFGPLQIIVGLAQAASRDKELLAAYYPIVSADDFKDEQAVIRASFDPAKMFALKAMLWDLQLQELEKNADTRDLVPSIFFSPYILHGETARELALLSGARELVQFPERATDIYDRMTRLELEHVLARLVRAADMWGSERPKLDGIAYSKAGKLETCPPTAFGAVRRGDGSQICISADTSEPRPPRRP